MVWREVVIFGLMICKVLSTCVGIHSMIESIGVVSGRCVNSRCELGFGWSSFGGFVVTSRCSELFRGWLFWRCVSWRSGCGREWFLDGKSNGKSWFFVVGFWARSWLARRSFLHSVRNHTANGKMWLWLSQRSVGEISGLLVDKLRNSPGAWRMMMGEWSLLKWVKLEKEWAGEGKEISVFAEMWTSWDVGNMDRCKTQIAIFPEGKHVPWTLLGEMEPALNVFSVFLTRAILLRPHHSSVVRFSCFSPRTHFVVEHFLFLVFFNLNSLLQYFTPFTLASVTHTTTYFPTQPHRLPFQHTIHRFIQNKPRTVDFGHILAFPIKCPHHWQRSQNSRCFVTHVSARAQISAWAGVKMVLHAKFVNAHSRFIVGTPVVRSIKKLKFKWPKSRAECYFVCV